MKIFFWRFVSVVATAVSLIGYPKLADAMTVDVTVAPNGELVFSPSSVTIHPGDTVRWTWSQSFHSSTSGIPGAANGIWNSGILNQGAHFSHTFNSTGTFPYYCIPHGGCCGMVGTVMVVNESPTPTPRPTATPTATPSPAPATTLGNISTRSFVQTGDNVMIGGFIIHGNEQKRVIIRAIGPELTPFGVPDVLANPTLELHDGSGALIAFNDDWQHTIIGGIITSDQVSDIVMSGHAPADPSESAIIAELPAGNYTAIVRGAGNSTGVALVEVYDLNSGTTSILGNISTRAFVQTGDNVMIGGFIVHGTGSEPVIVRAIGPELTPFGVPSALADPTLELHNGAGALIASNDNWQTTILGGIITHSQVQDIMNSGHAPTDPRESAVIANLPAGNYTAIVRGVNNTTGVALVEVYDLH
jgi:plastocyanin